jgi:energy-coupling factor transporter ATP-binding protein EcfA2
MAMKTKADVGHHLEELEVKDFKSLKAVKVSLGQINVFIGANGSGKSNLLEAIGVLGAAASGIVDDQALLRRGVRPGVPELYKSAFHGDTIAPKISLRARSVAGVDYRAYLTNSSKSPVPSWRFGNETIVDGKKKIASRGPKANAKALDLSLPLENDRSVTTLVRASMKTPASVRAFLATLDDYAIFSPVTPVLRGIAPDTAPRNPVGLFGGQLPEAVGLLKMGNGKKGAQASSFDEVLELIDWASEIDIGPPSGKFLSPSVPTSRYVLRFKDRFMARGRNVLSGYDASEGALYILFMLVLATHGQSPQSLAVDNFDQALNPRTARAVTRMFVSRMEANGRQAFLTTHNPLVLDGLPLGEPHVKLFTVARDRGGKTIVRPVPVRNIAALKEEHGEFALSRLWITGRLGGMPNV